MKYLFLILLAGVVGFSPDSKTPRYFVGQAHVSGDNNIHYNICYIIRANNEQEADMMCRREVKRRQKVTLPKTNTNESKNDTYSLWEIDFDNVLTK